MLFPKSILSKSTDYLKIKKPNPKPTSVNRDLTARRLQRNSVLSSSLLNTVATVVDANDTKLQGRDGRNDEPNLTRWTFTGINMSQFLSRNTEASMKIT